MNKKVLRAGAVSAVAAGIGAAQPYNTALYWQESAAVKKKRKTVTTAIQNLVSLRKTARVFIIPMVTMRLLQDRKSRKELKKRALI